MLGECSHRIAAAVATATLIDYKIISADDTSQIILKDKIQREIDWQVELEIDENQPIVCVFFDGQIFRCAIASLERVCLSIRPLRLLC